MHSKIFFSCPTKKRLYRLKSVLNMCIQKNILIALQNRSFLYRLKYVLNMWGFKKISYYTLDLTAALVRQNFLLSAQNQNYLQSQSLGCL